MGLGSQQRIKNIIDAFRVENHEIAARKTVLLIDDVMTTGATARECSRVLKMAGAACVYAVVLAHGVND